MSDRLLAIVGPTASGKSALGIEIARHHNGEIICADSRTVYRGMDSGTAKPSLEDQRQVPHHLLDVADPDKPFSAAEFQRLARAAIDDIHHRGRLPILVGGTGLYVDAVLYDYQFPAGASASRRAELGRLPLPELVKRLEAQDPERAATVDLHNPRRVIRALELIGQPRVAPKSLAAGTCIVGLDPGMTELERRIADRTNQQLESGLIDETCRLLDRYDPVIESLNTVPYREVIQFLRGELSRDQLPELIALRNRQLAKRQLTWFKRNPDIHWATGATDAKTAVDRWISQAV